MPELLKDYLPIVVFMGVCAAIGIALMASSFILAYRKPDPEKLSAYECGFAAFDDARMKFDVRFYLVSRSCFPGPSRSRKLACLASGP